MENSVNCKWNGVMHRIFACSIFVIGIVSFVRQMACIEGNYYSYSYVLVPALASGLVTLLGSIAVGWVLLDQVHNRELNACVCGATKFKWRPAWMIAFCLCCFVGVFFVMVLIWTCIVKESAFNHAVDHGILESWFDVFRVDFKAKYYRWSDTYSSLYDYIKTFGNDYRPLMILNSLVGLWLSFGFARFCAVFSYNSSAMRSLKGIAGKTDAEREAIALVEREISEAKSKAERDALAKIHEKFGIPQVNDELKNEVGVKSAGEAKTDCIEKNKEPEEDKKSLLEDLASLMILIPGNNYKICKYEVTQALWMAVMGNNPSRFRGTDHPVEQVSWNDCQEFIKKLNTFTGGSYRLPTEEEWEYACRAGSTGKYGNIADGTEGKLDDMGWYDGNSGSQTHPVGQKKPNAFGLYDMHGNVWEWTSSLYSSSGVDRVCRGGSWNGNADFCESECRAGTLPGDRYDDLGFRLASSAGL